MMEIKEEIGEGITVTDEFGSLHFNDYNDLMRTLRIGKNETDKVTISTNTFKEFKDGAIVMPSIDEQMKKFNDSFTLLAGYSYSTYHNPNEIKNVIFNDPATIVFWGDGTKTVVKCDKDDIYDPEKGLAMAISKRFLGDKGNYYNEFKKWLPETTLSDLLDFKEVTISTDTSKEFKAGAIAMPSLDNMMKNLNTSINDSIKNIRIG